MHKPRPTDPMRKKAGIVRRPSALHLRSPNPLRAVGAQRANQGITIE